MKKLYFGALTICSILLFGLSQQSCSKKEDPAPAPAPAPAPTPTPTPSGVNNTPTSRTAMGAADRGDGTVRTSPTTTTTPSGSTVTVRDQSNQRGSMNTSAATNLDELLGTSSAQSKRTEENKNFAWYFKSISVNGVKYTDQQLEAVQSFFFFNIDESGYYWSYDLNEEDWDWGTWAVDTGMTTIAFDYNGTNFEEVWDIESVSPSQMVVTTKADIDGDKKADDLKIVFKPYDIDNPSANLESFFSDSYRNSSRKHPQCCSLQ